MCQSSAVGERSSEICMRTNLFHEYIRSLTAIAEPQINLTELDTDPDAVLEIKIFVGQY